MANSYLDLLFTPEHEWVRPRGSTMRVGITDFAQNELGEVIYCECPKPGQQLTKGQEAGTIESVKAVAELYAPLSCIVKSINHMVIEYPEVVNDDPYGDGWFFEGEILDNSELSSLINFVDYKVGVLQDIEHIIYLDESNRLHYLPAVRGEDGRIIVGGKDFESAITASLVSVHTLTADDIIEEFEHLINKPGLKELELQGFFEHHPEFLLGTDYESLYPQVVLKSGADEALKPDFILKPLAGVSYGAKIVELKLPVENIAKLTPRRQGLYANIHEAIAQLRTYARYFDEQKNRKYVQDTLGFSAYRPRLALIVGRELTLADEQVKANILEAAQPVELLTYNDLLEKYKRLAQWRK